MASTSKPRSSRTKPSRTKPSRAKPSRLKVREHRERLRRQGLRPIQIWVLAVAASSHGTRRAFFARTRTLLSTENPTFSARMMVAIVSKRGLAPGASVL